MPHLRSHPGSHRLTVIVDVPITRKGFFQYSTDLRPPKVKMRIPKILEANASAKITITTTK